LDIGYNQISDISTLSSLTGLVGLNLGFGTLFLYEDFNPMETGTNLLDDTDLDVLNSLTNLQMLSIGGLDSVTSLSYLSNLTSLTQLWMGSNPISDWTPLGAVASNLNAFFVANCGLGQTELENYVADMTSIQYVDESNIGMLGILIEPGITDLSSLDQLNPSIAFLALLGITNIDFAQNWTNLYIFICFGMGITNINGLIGLQNLTLAVLGSNNIGPTMFTEGVTPAALNSLTGISLAENKLESISGIEYMPNLNSFDASNNLITDISSLSNSPNTGTLESLMLSNNQIEEINSLKECIELDIVHLDHNQIQDFTPLVENEGIGNGDYIDISYNPVPPELCDVVDQLVAKVQPDGGVNRNGVCDITVIVEIEGTGNTSPPAGESHILIGSPLGISAYPQANSGQAFDHWEIWDEGTSSYIFLTDSSGYNFSDVQQDIKVKAVFVPGTYNLTFNIDPTSTGTGTVWPLDGGPGVYSYKENQIVHLSANPSPGSAFAGWTGDIGSVDPMSPGLSIVMNSDKVITAKFSEPDYIVLLSIEGPGTIVPSPGTYYFVSGQWMNLNAMPGPGKAFLGWYEGESLLSKDLSYGLQVTADHIIVARFGEPDYIVTLSVEGPGTINPAPGEYYFSEGQQMVLNATPDPGKIFLGWYEGEMLLSDSTFYSFEVTANHNIVARFSEPDYIVTLSVEGPGTINPAPGEYYFSEGQQMVLNATPDPGKIFLGWYEGEMLLSDYPIYGFEVTADRNIVARFSEPDYIVTLSVEGPGTISPMPGTYYFVSGQWMNLNAVPDSGKAFLGWYEGEELLSKDLSYGLQVTADHIIVARFGEPDYIVTLSVEGPGTINPAPGEYYFSEGQQMVLFATPDPGKVFLGWYEGEMLLSDHPIYGFGVMANRNIVARFGEPDYIVTLSVDGPGTINPAPGEYYFSEGQQMALFATPDPGKAFLGWYEGGELLSKNTYYNLEVTANHNIVARFGDANYTVTLSVEGPGTINPAPGEYYFSEGQLMYLFATPDPGKAFLGWYEGEMLLSDYPIYGFEVTANRNIVARFSEPDFTITLVISGNGTTNPIPGTYGYKAGGNAGFFATPDSGYAFLHWEINDGVDIRYEINTSLSLQVQANLTVTAVFSNQDECTWNVNTSLAGTGIGWISPSPSNYCFMTEQELAISTGTIENNYFGGIQLVKDPLGTPEESWVYWFFHKLNVDADYNVTAHFENTGWMFRLNIEGYGLVFASDGETMIYPSSHALANNFPLKLTAVANIEEMPFRGWYSNGVRISTEPVFETTLNSDLQLTARFAPYAWYQLVISLVEGEGTTNPAPGGYSYIEGSTVEVKAIPDAGWAFSNWVGDIDGIENIDQPIINVPIDKTRYIGVIFVELPPEGEGTTEGTIEGTTEGTVEGAVEGEIGPHSADRDGDGVISLSELLRVIQFFNMGGYHCDPSNEEDGYAGGIEGDHSCTPHASDYDEQDWTIDLGELLRLIQFFNIGGYHPCPGIGEDDYCPGLVG